MPIRITRALIFFLALLATGCSHMIDPDIKQNPHPVKRYEITMTIDGAPGPFDSVTGFMQYDVSNHLCVPQDSLSGARPTPDFPLPITFNRASENVYKGIVYLDLLQDENYYDLGVCHWRMTAAVVILKRKGSGIDFSPDASFDDVVAQKPITRYFAKKLFFDTDPHEIGVGGVPLSDTVAKYRSDYFSITLAAKENLP